MRPTRPTQRTARPGAGPSLFESLEARSLLSGFTWTPQEVYLLELVNRARYDPYAEGQRVDVDLVTGLTAGELANLVPSEPLALNSSLTLAARAHAQDMATRAFFAHVNPDGLDPTARAVMQGYAGQAGENIAAGYSDIDTAHQAWLDSVSHRKNVLSLHEDFDATYRYMEFGAGIFFPGFSAPYTSYYVEEFGIPAAKQPYVLGVVYDDTDHNNFYSVGEGRANVRVDVIPASGPVYSYTTDSAGNYQISVPDGDYTIRFTDLNTNAVTEAPLTVQDKNVKIDAVSPAAAGPLSVLTYLYNGAQPGAVVNGSSQTGDYLTAVTTDRLGRFVAYTQLPGGAWLYTNVSGLSGAPLPTGQITTWTRPGDPNTYAAAPSASGLIIYTRSSTGAWTYRNITAEIAGSLNIESGITSYLDLSNLAHVAGLDGAGQLVMYSESANGSWSFANLTVDHIQAQGQYMPAFTGPLISYVTSWGGQNIAGLDSSGSIFSIWWAPGLTLWQSADLTVVTGAAPLAGGLTAYLTSWGGINLAGLDAAGNVSVTWWVPDFGPDWRNSNLTQAFAGPALQAASTSSFVTPWGGLNIVGTDQYGGIIIYWWAPGMDAWNASPLTVIIPGATAPSGAIRGITSPEGTTSLLGVRADGHMLRYHWAPGGQWACDDLTATV